MNDIFISYSRKDTEFVRRLFTALEQQKHQSWVDWEGIDYSTKWWEEICAGIERANNFVFIISPDALNSKYCHDEITHARKFNKRIIPFTYVELDEEKWRHQPLTDQALDNWAYLKSLQFISYPKLNDFDKAVAALIETANKDPEYIQSHTELLAAAHEWKNAGKSPGFLLRDDRLIQAEEWLKQAISTSKNPAPTQEQQDFIAASHKLADTHLRQLKQFIAAAVALVTLVILFAMASTILFNQASHTRDQIATAILAREQALAAEATTVAQVATATNEQGKAQNAAATATIAQGAAVYAQATAVAQAESAQKDAQIAHTQVAIAGITLTSVPPTLTAVASAAADAKVEQIISQQLANASLQLLGKQNEGALQIANKLVQTYPNKVSVYVGRGLINTNTNKVDNAVADYSKAIELDPTFATTYYDRGSSYLQNMQYDEAIADFDKAIELVPDFVLAYNNRGFTYASKQLYNQALIDLTKAIQLDPTLALAYENRGLTYLHLRQFAEAIADYTKAIGLTPNDATTYYDRARVYIAANEFNMALIDLTQAIEIAPTFSLAYVSRGVAYFNLQQYDNALTDYNKALEIDPNLALAYANRGYFYNRQNHFDKAVSDFSMAIRLDPTADSYLARGYAYGMLAQYDQAIPDFSKALELSPKYINAYLWRGDSYFYTQHYKEALADWKKFEAKGGSLPSDTIQLRAEAEAGLSQTPTVIPQ